MKKYYTLLLILLLTSGQMWGQTQLTISYSVTPGNCSLGLSGNIAGNVSGGVPPYNYSWVNFAGTGSASDTGSIITISPAAIGSNIITVTDSLSNSVTDTVIVQDTSAGLQPVASVFYTSCTGQVRVRTQYTDPRNIYYWSNGDQDAETWNWGNGTHSVTVTYTNGCTGVDTFQVDTTGLNALNTELNPTYPACNQTGGSFHPTVWGGHPPYSYNWSTGDTTLAVNNLQGGYYELTVTDSSGCTIVRFDTIPWNTSYTDIWVAEYSNYGCNMNMGGSAILYYITDSLPITYQWSTGDTGQVVENLPVGNHSVTATDARGCQDTAMVTIGIDDDMTYSVVDIGPANCFNYGGSIELLVECGSPPYNYQWSNGDTTDMIDSLSTGLYYFTVTDSLGNFRNDSVLVPMDSAVCFAQISGVAYVDLNGNCVQDSGEVGLRNVLVEIDSGYYAYTGDSGHYSVFVDPDNYLVASLATAPGFSSFCDSNGIAVSVPNPGDQVDNVNFGIDPADVEDLAVYIDCGIARGWTFQTVTITVENLGYTTHDMVFTVEFDSLVHRVDSISSNAQVNVLSTSPYVIQFTVPGVQAGAAQQVSMLVGLNGMHGGVFVGSIITHSVTLDVQGVTEIDTTNNTDYCSEIVVASADPNDKQVTSNGVDVDGDAMPADTMLDYRIRFQNTGTDTAFNVVVVDTLDTHLDVHTFRVIATSHPYHVDFDGDHIIHFVFDNIMLPDSNVNEPASHGFVHYQIKVAEPELLDIPISNQAAIYFDVNDPVFTNTVIITRKEPVDTSDAVVELHAMLSLYPNPATDKILIEAGGLAINSYCIYSQTGKMVQCSDVQPQLRLPVDVSALEPGVYIVRASTKKTSLVQKLIILR